MTLSTIVYPEIEALRYLIEEQKKKIFELEEEVILLRSLETSYQKIISSLEDIHKCKSDDCALCGWENAAERTEVV